MPINSLTDPDRGATHLGSAVPLGSLRLERAFILAAVLYILIALFGDSIVLLVVDPSASSDLTLATSRATTIQSLKLIMATAVAGLILCQVPLGNEVLRRSLQGSFKVAFWTLIITAGVSLFLNAMGWWPFTWRFADSGAVHYMQTLIESDNQLAIGLWTINVIVLIPFIEESLFRYWLLRLLQRWSRSDLVAILGSATVFALLHLGNPLTASGTHHLSNAGWLFVFSILLAAVTLKHDGRIMIALVAHIGRNTLEISTLFVSVVGGYAV